ncbi:MAG: TonB-dependent receptor [Acidobacteriota bacterium]
MKSFQLFFLLPAIFVGLCWTSPALDAQEEGSTAAGSESEAESREVTQAEATDPTVIEEQIVVTGSLIQESLQETPESVAVWNSDTMTDAGMGELQDIFNQTANAYQIANGEGFGIRGINHNSVGTGGAGELGSYYTDGVAITGFAKRYGPMQLWDVEQVEILRGPQTTNVGRNALAGAVILNTKDPVFRSENRWRLGLAEEGTWDLAGAVNVVFSESSALRVTAETWNTDGFVSNPTRGEDDFDARENETFRAKYLYQPTSRNDFSLLVTAQYGETLRGNDAVDLGRRDERVNTSNLDDFEESDSLVLSMDLDWAFNDRWTLQSTTSYLDSEYRRFDDDDQGPGGGNSFRGRTAVDKNWAQDLRFAYTGDDVRGVTGVYYTDVELDNDTVGEIFIRAEDLGIPSFLAPFYPPLLALRGDLPAVFDTTNFAFFTRWDWRVSDRWSAFAGLRWDLEEQDSDRLSQTTLLSELPDPATPGLPPALAGAIAAVNQLLLSQVGTNSVVTSTDYDALLPEFGISYDWNNDVSTTLFYKRGYRAGGAELSLVGQLNEYDPEFLDLVELSLRSAQNRWTVNGNVYFGSWSDQQVNVQQSDNAFDFITENAGEAEIYGFELDTSYRPLESWDFYASVGFAHTEFTEFESATQGDLSGNRFGGAPEWTGALGVNYRFDGGWFVHGDIGYQGSAFATVENDPQLRLESRTLLNFRGGYETARYSILAYVDNATDETYAVTAFRNVDGRLLGKLGSPRQAGIQLILRF